MSCELPRAEDFLEWGLKKHLPERFLDKMEVDENGCWVWTGAKGGGNYGYWYGYIWWKGKSARAHRVSYEVLKGEIPDGMELHHKCEVTLCVNPKHLELTDHAGNMSYSRTMVLGGTCKNGHHLDEDTFRTKSNGYGWCKSCNTEAARRNRVCALCGGKGHSRRECPTP